MFLDRAATTERVLEWIERAADQGVKLLAFGETYLPGYPFWIGETDGARFEAADQKEVYAAYLDAAIRADGRELQEIAAAAKRFELTVVLGAAERGVGCATGSLWASAFVVHPDRGVAPAHRKLVPTYEERLAWAHGDGHGLRPHDVQGTTVTVLNCWENWMPLARHACWANGAEVHVALWPGSEKLTRDITRFAAREGRVFILSACAVLAPEDVPATFPLRAALGERSAPYQDGGSAVAGPDGEWVVAPVVGERRLVIADLDLAAVLRERQSLDPTGHYARPDVFEVAVSRRRLEAARFGEDGECASETQSIASEESR